MTTTTTRAGFVVATDNTDATDHNIVCYDNNITQLEAEVGTPIQGSLPSSGNFEGRVKAINYTAPANFGPPGTLEDNYVRATVSPNAQNWIRIGGSSQFRFPNGTTWGLNAANTATVTASGSEVFQSVPCDASFIQLFNQNFNSQVTFKFVCEVAIDFSQQTAGTLGKIIGAFNIFINPVAQDTSVNAPTPPTPTTPGVVRISFPIIFGSDSVMTHNANGQHVVNGELFWTMPAPQPSWPATYGFGVSAYLSATQTNGAVGVKYGATPDSSGIYTEDCGVV